MSSCPEPDPEPGLGAAGIGLLAGIAHDLRTPLARLRLRAELACPEEVSRAMEPDFLAVTQLIDQILGYAQGCMAVTGGGQVPLTELLSACVAQHGAPERPLGLGRVDACFRQVPLLPMQRVLANLIGNALAHGLGPVQVELHAVPGTRGGVQVLVFDHGPGLARHQLARALQPFVQLGDAALPATRHCGLGLAIVAQIAQQLGGRVVRKPFDGARSGIGIHIPA